MGVKGVVSEDSNSRKHNTTANMEVVDLTASDGEEASTAVRVIVQGPPKALPRSRHHPGGWWNTVQPQFVAFRMATVAQNPGLNHGIAFPAGVPVAVTVRCFLRQPNSDFKKGNRIAGMLKNLVAFVGPIHPDIDNLAKFVLDGLNGVAYADDRQVVKLVVYKLLDSQGNCDGRTEVEVLRFGS